MDDDERQTCDVDDADLDDELPPTERLPQEWYSSGRDEIGSTTADLISVQTQVPWPSSWVQLVQTVRRLHPRCILGTIFRLGKNDRRFPR